MKLTERMRKILYKKLKPWNDYKECVAYPIEIKYLLTLGCEAERGQSKYYAEQVGKQIAIGQNDSTWFYFVPTKELLKLVRERFPVWQQFKGIKK